MIAGVLASGVRSTLCVLTAVLLALGVGGTASAQVLSQLSPDTVYVGQEATYTVLVRGATAARMDPPEVEGLSFEFVEEGVTNVSSSIRIVNGRRSERQSADYVFRYRVTATGPGRYVLPAPEVEAEGQSRRGSSTSLRVEDPGDIDEARIRVRCEPPAVVLGQEATLIVEVDLKFLPAGVENRDPLAMYDRSRSFFDEGTPPPSIALPWMLSPPQGLGTLDLNDWVESRRQRTGLRLTYQGGSLRGRYLEPSRRERVTAPDAEGRDAEYWRLRFTLPIRGEIAGKYQLPAAKLEGQVVVQQGRDLVWRPIFLATDPLRFEVLEPPREGRPAAYSGAVGSFRFSMDPPTPTTLRVGDPVYLTLVVQGRGFVKGVNPNFADALAGEFRVERVATTDSLPDGAERPAGFPDRPGTWRQWDYKLYPVSADVQRIPPLEFSWYDPEKREYVVQSTAEVPLQVTESAGGPSRVVVGSGAGDRPSEVELVATSALSANVTDRNLLEDQRPSLALPLWGLGGMLGAYAALAAVVRRRRRLDADPSLLRRAKAAGRARDRLRAAVAASDATAAFEALCGYVADVDGGDEKARTGQDLLLWFRHQSVGEDSLRKLSELSEAVEAAAFGGGGSAEQTQALLQGLSAVLDEGERRRRASAGKASSFAGLCVALSLLATPQDLDLFQQAETAAEAGDWAGAAQAYEEMLAGEYENGWVLYNLGNCHLRAGNLGRAIAAYRRAQRYLPDDANLDLHLRRALESRSRPLSLPEQTGWLDHVLFWRGALSYAQQVRWALAFGALVFAAAVARLLMTRPPGALQAVIVVGLLVTALMSLSASLDLREMTARDRGVITEDATVLRSGPGSSYEPSWEQTIDQGSELQVEAERDDWVKVRVGGKYEGWVPRTAVARW